MVVRGIRLEKAGWRLLDSDGQINAEAVVPGMGALIGLDVLRPSYGWLSDNMFAAVWRRMGRHRDPVTYAIVAGWAKTAPGRPTPSAHHAD